MIANVRRRFTSWASGARDGDSVVTAVSVMVASVWQRNEAGSREIQKSMHLHLIFGYPIVIGEDDLAIITPAGTALS
jgi:hypothetical protein